MNATSQFAQAMKSVLIRQDRIHADVYGDMNALDHNVKVINYRNHHSKFVYSLIPSLHPFVVRCCMLVLTK